MDLKGFALLFGFIVISIKNGQGDVCELPPLPKFYTTNMMINIPHTLRKSVGDNEGEKGVTVNVYQAIDETLGRAMMELFYEFNPRTNRAMRIKESVIFNTEMEGVKNFVNFFDVDGYVGCYADAVHGDSILDFIFGIDPEHPVFPSVGNMLHFGKEYHCAGEDVILGIPTKVFKANFTSENPVGELTSTYYWSNVDVWDGSAGTGVSVPVLAKIHGHLQLAPEVPMAEVAFEILFEKFMEVEPTPHIFYPPRDIWCDGRKPTKTLRSLPETFSYENEVIYRWMFPDSPEVDAIVKMTEYYDFRMKASRSDYKPLDFSNPQNPFAGDSGFITAVKDFHAGVQYSTYEDWGNCTAEFIGFDITGDVVFHPDGSVVMMSPFHLWHLDAKYTFNGYTTDRGILMGSYVALIEPFTPTDDMKKPTNWTNVLYITAGNYAELNDTGMESKVPVRFEFYPTLEYNNKKFRTVHNIIGLREHRPDFKHYDITSCFIGESVAHKTIRFPWSEVMIVEENPWEFEHEVRRAVHHAAQITTIRVQNMQLELVKDEQAMYVSFSIVDWPENLNKTAHPKIPPESVLPLADALTNLANNISASGLKINIRQQDSEELMELTADYTYFADGRREPSDPTPGKTYSPGAMAGLGICMLIIAFSGGLAVLVFILKW